MRFLDSNVFLFAALDRGVTGEIGRSLLREVSAATPAATNVVVLNEVFWNLRKPAGRDEGLRWAERFNDLPGLVVLPIRLGEWRRAVSLMREHPTLKPNDALHAATALEAGISEIVSTDPDFDGMQGLIRVDLAPKSRTA